MTGRPISSLSVLRSWGPVAVLALGLTACATPPSAPSPPPPPPPKASDPADPADTSSSAAEAAADERRAAAPATAPAAPAESTEASESSAQASTTSASADASPAPAAAPGSPGGAGGGDRMAELDDAFEESLGVFDERLAREQVAVRQQQEAAAADRAARGASDGSGNEEGSAANWPPPPGGSDTYGDSDTGPGGSREGRPSPGNRSGLPVPEDVADGSGDDIVARQLREAAMAETDPELAEKLWDEYRDYKRKQ